MSSRSNSDLPGTAGSYRACASCGSQAASRAGLEVLEAGGNAADAASAMLLTLSVTNLGAVCPGGEAAGIVSMVDGGAPRVICGQGRAPLSASVTSWKPALARGSLQDATTPALISYVCTLLGEFGTFSLADTADSFLRQLRDGRSFSHFDTVLRREINTLTGEFVQPGQLETHPPIRQWWADLSDTTNRLLVQEARHSENRQLGIRAAHHEFYEGETASLLGAWYKDKNALLTADDLSACTSPVEEPVTTRFGDFEVHTTGPWTQGPMLNMALNTAKAAGIDNMAYGSADYLHTVIETLKLGFADRDRYLADPEFADVPLDSLLDPNYASIRARCIKRRRAAVRPVPGFVKTNGKATPGGPGIVHDKGASTVCCLVSDRWGNVVITTPSGVSSIAGSGGRTGVTHGTRMGAFNLQLGHPNAAAPGKRPCSSLAPVIVTRHGRVVMGFSTPGGNFQLQVALQILLNVARFGLRRNNIERVCKGESTAALFYQPGSETKRSGIFLSKSVPDTIRNALSKRGHLSMPGRIDLQTLGGGVIYWDDDESNYRVFGHRAVHSDLRKSSDAGV